MSTRIQKRRHVMGTSFVEYRQHGFWARDSCLEVWLYTLAAEIDRLPELSPWHRTLRDHWYEQAKFGGVGCLWVGLDDYVTTEEEITAVIQLCEAALRTLEAHGETISHGYLNQIASEGSHWPRDVDTTLFTRTGQACIRLLRGEITTDAATSPVL
jgi:hypothetical protein